MSDQPKLSGAHSWTGNTFVVIGHSITAPARGVDGRHILATTDDSDTWSSWMTDDIATMTVIHGLWYDKDLYLTSGGEGIMVLRGAER